MRFLVVSGRFLCAFGWRTGPVRGHLGNLVPACPLVGSDELAHTNLHILLDGRRRVRAAGHNERPAAEAGLLWRAFSGALRSLLLPPGLVEAFFIPLSKLT